MTNLWPALDGVSNWWDHLGLCDCLQVPKSVQQEIQQQTSNVTQQKKTLLERWLHDHPASSWAVVAEALYWMEEHDVLEQVKKMYIIQGVFYRSNRLIVNFILKYSRSE